MRSSAADRVRRPISGFGPGAKPIPHRGSPLDLIGDLGPKTFCSVHHTTVPPNPGYAPEISIHLCTLSRRQVHCTQHTAHTQNASPKYTVSKTVRAKISLLETPINRSNQRQSIECCVPQPVKCCSSCLHIIPP